MGLPLSRKGMSNARSLSAIASKIIAHFNSNASVPTGAVFDWALNTAPAGYILCDGSLLGPATPYPALRNALIADGFPHGQDGSGNPRLPDARGRVTAGKDNMGGTAAGRLTAGGSGVNGAALGAAGGAETHTLSAAQMPVHNHGVNDPGHTHTFANGAAAYTNQTTQTWGGGPAGGITASTLNYSLTGISIQNAGSGAAHNNTQPTLVLNKIIKT